MIKVHLLNYYSQQAKGDASTALESLVITQCLRSDRVKAAADLYVRCVMGDQFMHDSEQEIDLAKVVQSEIKVRCLCIDK